MAFDPLQMSLLVGANGNSLWYYKSLIPSDNHTEIISADFFAPHAEVLNVGDVIFIQGGQGLNDILFVKTVTLTPTLGVTTAALAAATGPLLADDGEGTKEALAAAKARAQPKDVGDNGSKDKPPSSPPKAGRDDPDDHEADHAQPPHRRGR